MKNNIGNAYTFCSIILLTSCASLPEKPSVELGVIDFPAGQVVTNMTGAKSFKKIDSTAKATYPNMVRAIVLGGSRVPLASYDRAICFKPDFWQTEVEYIHDLERYIVSHCSAEQ